MKKSILFIQPLRPSVSIYPLSLPPLGLLTLASLTDKSKYDITIIDENQQKADFSQNYDIVCISVILYCKERAYMLAKMFKSQGATVMLGGPQVTLCPEETRKYGTIQIRGNGEFIWEKVLDDYENGKLKPEYVCTEEGFRKVRLDWSIIKTKYLFYNLILTTRGCPHRCGYCQIPGLFGKKVHHKKVDDVIEEIKSRKKEGWFKDWIFICDDNLIADKGYAVSLFKELAKLKLKIISQCSINIARDDELLNLAQKAGLRLISVGFESMNQSSLNAVRKPNKSRDYLPLVKKLEDKGIYVMTGSFIVGLEEDTEKDILQSLKLAMNTTFFAEFNPLMYLPKTEIAQKMNCGDITDTAIVKKTKNISDVARLVHYCHLKYYSLRQIFFRTFKVIRIKRNPKYFLPYFFYSVCLYFKVRKNKI